MGHRMNFIRRPSSFLLIPVGLSGRDLQFEGLAQPTNPLPAQRSDIGSYVGGFDPTQGKVRHLRMRIKKEEGESLRAEIRPVRNRCEGGHVGAGLDLATLHDMAARAPAPGEIGAVIGISCESRRRIEARDRREQKPNSSYPCAHLITYMNLLAD